MNLELKQTNPQAEPKPGKSYRICTRCIIDTTHPGVSFDEQGVCNFCKVHERLDQQFPLNEKGRQQLDRIISKIKKDGKNKKYDCIAGVSGGRDSTYTLYLAKKVFGLRSLAVHFNDGFGNPVTGENMMKATSKLGVDLRTITSDWRESKDLKIACLKASTVDMEIGTDLGIGSTLYGVAAKENVKYILFGQSFRTEGIAPLSWNYLDGKYLKAIHRKYGTVPLRKWEPNDPGFNLDLPHVLYYSLWRRIKTVCLLYWIPYVRRETDEILKKELGWVYPGAHYFDDLYQSLLNYVYRVKFNMDRRIFNYSALIRSGQMSRAEALERVKEIYVIEDPDVIRLCIKRLGLTQAEFEQFLAMPPKYFRDFPNNYVVISKFKWLIKILSQLNIVPGATYEKYFNCGI